MPIELGQGIFCRRFQNRLQLVLHPVNIGEHTAEYVFGRGRGC
jgi:hypothetical protein